MVDEIRVGIAGLGYWGPNLLRNFRSVEGFRVAAMADLSSARVGSLARLYPDVACMESAEEIIADDSIDALVLALPAALLPDLATQALAAGKHVMVEKPMADSLSAGARMLEAARATDRAAMVDFTFVYSPPVRELKRLFDSGAIGEPHYYQSTRINLGRFQPDIDVVWDLVVHDVAILAYVLERDPVSVTATGRGRGPRVDTANVTLTYEDGLQAFIHVSWMAPMKVRTSLLACDQGMIVYDDVQSDEKIKIYRVQGQFDPETENALVPTFRLGDVSIPRLPQEEPLGVVASTFLEGCRGNATPLTDWNFGVRVLAVLEAARESLSTAQAVPVSTAAVAV